MAEPPAFDERWAVVLMDDVQRYSAVQQHAAFSWFVQAQALQARRARRGRVPPADLQLREDLRTRLAGATCSAAGAERAERRAVLRQAGRTRAAFS
jgi:DnaA family protein